MKETNTTMILEVIDQILAQEKWTFYEPTFATQIRPFLLAAYMANDTVIHVSITDRENETTYIVSHERIDVIIDGHHSYWKCVGGVCRYEDLNEDIWRLVSGLQYAALRVD